MRQSSMKKALDTWDGMTMCGFVNDPCPPVKSTLSQILEVNAPEKYYLSPKACAGILRRAERRGKELPPMLKEALEEAISLSTNQEKDTGCRDSDV